MKKLFIIGLITLGTPCAGGDLFTKAEYKTYVDARTAVDKVLEGIERLIEDPDNSLTRLGVNPNYKQKIEVNPYYNKTSKGIILNYSYGEPSSIFTPWGEVRFQIPPCTILSKSELAKTTFSVEQALEKELKELGVSIKLHTPTKEVMFGSIPWGYTGPLYTITHLEGVELHEDGDFNEGLVDPDYDLVMKKWKAMTEKYGKSEQWVVIENS